MSNEMLIKITADITAAYVSNNTAQTAELPGLISSLFSALAQIANPAAAEIQSEPLKPAVSIRKSVTPDYIVCLEDGKKLKMLKRHLLATYDMTPDEYRIKWGLPADYPMVAPSYAAQRSELAKAAGLGREGRRGKIQGITDDTPKPASRGRKASAGQE